MYATMHDEIDGFTNDTVSPTYLSGRLWVALPDNWWGNESFLQTVQPYLGGKYFT